MKVLEEIQRLEKYSRSKTYAGRRALLSALAHKSPSVRSTAATLLAEIGEPRAIPLIASLLDDTNREVRYFAAESIGTLLSGTGKAPIQLVRLLRAPDPLVRVQALDPFLSFEIGDMFNLSSSSSTTTMRS